MKKVINKVMFPFMVGTALVGSTVSAFAEEANDIQKLHTRVYSKDNVRKYSNINITDAKYQENYMERLASLYQSLAGDGDGVYISPKVLKFAAEHKDGGIITVVLNTEKLIRFSNEVQALKDGEAKPTSSNVAVDIEHQEEELDKIKEAITQNTAEIVVREAEKKADVKPQAEKRAEVKEKITAAITETAKPVDVCTVIVKTQKGNSDNSLAIKDKEVVNELYNLAAQALKVYAVKNTNDVKNDVKYVVSVQPTVELDTKIKEAVSKIETQLIAEKNKKAITEVAVNKPENKVQESTPILNSYSGGSSNFSNVSSNVSRVEDLGDKVAKDDLIKSNLINENLTKENSELKKQMEGSGDKGAKDDLIKSNLINEDLTKENSELKKRMEDSGDKVAKDDLTKSNLINETLFTENMDLKRQVESDNKQKEYDNKKIKSLQDEVNKLKKQVQDTGKDDKLANEDESKEPDKQPDSAPSKTIKQQIEEKNDPILITQYEAYEAEVADLEKEKENLEKQKEELEKDNNDLKKGKTNSPLPPIPSIGGVGAPPPPPSGKNQKGLNDYQKDLKEVIKKGSKKDLSAYFNYDKISVPQQDNLQIQVEIGVQSYKTGGSKKIKLYFDNAGKLIKLNKVTGNPMNTNEKPPKLIEVEFSNIGQVKNLVDTIEKIKKLMDDNDKKISDLKKEISNRSSSIKDINEKIQGLLKEKNMKQRLQELGTAIEDTQKKLTDAESKGKSPGELQAIKDTIIQQLETLKKFMVENDGAIDTSDKKVYESQIRRIYTALNSGGPNLNNNKTPSKSRSDQIEELFAKQNRTNDETEDLKKMIDEEIKYIDSLPTRDKDPSVTLTSSAKSMKIMPLQNKLNALNKPSPQKPSNSSKNNNSGPFGFSGKNNHKPAMTPEQNKEVNKLTDGDSDMQQLKKSINAVDFDMNVRKQDIMKQVKIKKWPGLSESEIEGKYKALDLTTKEKMDKIVSVELKNDQDYKDKLAEKNRLSKELIVKQKEIENKYLEAEKEKQEIILQIETLEAKNDVADTAQLKDLYDKLLEWFTNKQLSLPLTPAEDQMEKDYQDKLSKLPKVTFGASGPMHMPLVIDNAANPSVESNISKERMDYLKKQIDIVNYEILAKAVKAGDIKKIEEVRAAIAKADLAMQKGNKEEIISMAKEAIKKNAENIKLYTPYWTAVEIAKKYLSVNKSESIPQGMTEEDIKKVCVINYFYAKNAAKELDANFSDVSDLERSAGVIKALCEKLNQDGLVPSTDYFDSLIYKRNTTKELDKDSIKGMIMAALSMSIADRQSPVDGTGHDRVLNEITSVPSDVTDLKQLEAWKETVKKYYSQTAK